MYQVEIQTYQSGNADWIVAHSPCHDDACRLYNGKLTLVQDGISDFQFSLLYGHPLFDQILPMRSRVKVYDLLTDTLLFVGRIMDPTNTMDGSGVIYRSFVAEGELGLLRDTMQRHQAFVKNTPANYLQQILQNHNTKSNGCVPDKRFTIGTVDITDPNTAVYRYITDKSSYDSIMEDLVEPLGGQIVLEYRNGENSRYLNYTKKVSGGEGINIQLAKNLLSLDEKQKPSGLVTRLVPLGAEYETYEDAVMILVNAGIIAENQNAWWIQQARYSDIKWLGQLLINLSKQSFTQSNTITTVTAAIEHLAQAGAINTPGYWENNYSKLSNLEALLLTAARKCNADAERPKSDTKVKRRLTIAAANSNVDYLDRADLISTYGIIEGSVTWDDVTDAGELKALGNAWLQSQVLYSSVTLSAVELAEAGESIHRFEVGKTYTASHAPLGINRQYQVTQKVINILKSHDSTLTFGDADTRITSMR